MSAGQHEAPPSPLVEYQPSPLPSEQSINLIPVSHPSIRSVRYAPYGSARASSARGSEEEESGLRGLSISTRSVSPPERLAHAYPSPRPVPTISARAHAHRRTQSLSSVTMRIPAFVLRRSSPPRPASTPLRRAIVLPDYDHPSTASVSPCPVSADAFTAPTLIPSSRIPTRPLSAAPRLIPSPTKKSAPLRRLILVNPSTAAHLRSGGNISVKSADGSRSWKVYLPPSPVISRVL